MSKWIPVSESLPPEPEGFKYVPVLAYWTGGEESPAGVDSSVYTGQREWQRANGSMDYHGGYGRVTHWMERPAPPEDTK